jgi:trimethylamine--corrinoid protein Co-methyltransferase
MLGMSGPATLAGSLVVANAEVLAGLTMHQTVAPGAPFIYGGCVSAFDMRDGCFAYGGPEWRVADCVLAQFARRYRLALFSTGGCSDSKLLDQQAVAEMTLSLAVPALSGCNLVHDVGYLQSGLCGHLSGLVIADEVISMVRRLLAPLRVDQEALAVDLICAVGPGGHFADSEHTVRHFRQETWLPGVFDRRTRSAWASAGASTAAEAAAERVDALLASHVPTPLPVALSARLDRMIRETIRSS